VYVSLDDFPVVPDALYPFKDTELEAAVKDDCICGEINSRNCPVHNEPSAHAFNAAVNETLDRARAISDQRGDEYLDSWALENIHTPFSDCVDRMLDAPPSIVDVERRLRLIAALIDVKISRLLGPWKDDTGIDLINYVAAFVAWSNELNQ